MLKTSLIFIGIIVLVVIIRIVYNYFWGEEDERDDFKIYKRKEFLLNIPERRFFEELQQSLPSNFSVFPQVVLSSIICVNGSIKNFWTYQNKINRKTIDFVIFEKPYFKPVLAIEYDGKSHDGFKRKERDNFVNEALKSAGIKIIHVRHGENFDFQVIKGSLEI